MSIDLETVILDSLLFATVSGKRNLETVREAAYQILQETNQSECIGVLVDVRGLIGDLPILDAYELTSTDFPKLGEKKTISAAAIVDQGENLEKLRFFENLAFNRGYNLRVFTEYPAAEAWIKSQFATLNPSQSG